VTRSPLADSVQQRARRHLQGLASLPAGEEIRASFDAELAEGPALAMVDSDRGITNSTSRAT